MSASKKVCSSSKGKNKTRATEQEPASWGKLPTMALLGIFRLMGDVDRLSLARVCTYFYEVFRTKSLWRQRFILFENCKNEQDIAMETLHKSDTGLLLSSAKSGISFVQKFRHCLKDLDICVKLNWPVSREILRDFKTLSENLDDAKLTHLKITYSGMPSLEGKRRDSYIKPLTRLIRNQNSLKNFQISLSYIDIRTGVHFLNCLAQASGKTLENLSLNHFFMSSDIHRDLRIVTEMQKFTNICSVSIDYGMLSEELMELWAQGYPTLSLIKLWAAKTGHEISSHAWKNLRATHPRLLVEILVQKVRSTDEMLPVLSPAMPVCKLLWELKYEVTSEIELTNLLHRVASYEKTIKHLFVKIYGKDITLDIFSVQILLSNCRKLLPFTCKNFRHPSTETDTWILSQDSGLRPQEDI